MRKVFHFDSPSERYRADATVLWCFDDRLSTVCRKFLRRIGVHRADLISIAGGAKALASPRDDAERDYVLDQIALSMRLHESRRIVLTLHSDCGAYNGRAAFRNSASAEAAHHWDELARAAQAVGFKSLAQSWKPISSISMACGRASKSRLSLEKWRACVRPSCGRRASAADWRTPRRVPKNDSGRTSA